MKILLNDNFNKLLLNFHISLISAIITRKLQIDLCKITQIWLKVFILSIALFVFLAILVFFDYYEIYKDYHMETIEHFNNKIAKGFVIVDFYAPWCGDCRRIDPILKELESEYRIHKINIDENENISSEFGIRRIPTLIFFKDGKEVGNRLIEPKSKTEIIEEINKI